MNYDQNYENDPRIRAEEGVGQYRRVIASGNLTGDRVRNPAGEDLGKIEEIMIDIPTGRVGYVVLAFGGVMGIGEKLFAVPWRALSLNEREHEFVLNIDRRQLEEAAGFDPNHWPDMTDPSWAAQIDEFYGAHERSRY
jgi:sporulation protein YlmC with PRC-barrel domain